MPAGQITDLLVSPQISRTLITYSYSCFPKDTEMLIILDTNIIRGNDEHLFGRRLVELTDFISEHDLSGDVKLGVPEVVIDELVSQRAEKFYKHDKISEKRKGSEPESKEEWRKRTREDAKEELRELGIEIISFPDIELSSVYSRVLSKKPPFSDGDRGFKDTLIWLSVLERSALMKEDTLIVLTNNTSDFQDNEKYLKDEFSLHSDKQLILEKEILELHEIIRKTYVPDEPSYDFTALKRAFQKNIGTVMVEVHKKKDFLLIKNDPIAFEFISGELVHVEEHEGKYSCEAELNVKMFTQQDFSKSSDAVSTFEGASSLDRSSFESLGITNPFTSSLNNLNERTTTLKVKLDIFLLDESINVRSVRMDPLSRHFGYIGL